MTSFFVYIPAGNPHTDPPTGEVFEAGQIYAFDDQVAAELAQANRIISAGAGFDVSQLVSGSAPSVDWGDITNRPADLSDPALVEAIAQAGLAHQRLDASDGLFGQVTIANASSGGWFTASGNSAVVTLPRTLDRSDYLVALEVISASPSTALAGQPRVTARSSNAFTIEAAGSARDVVVRWQIRNA
jgi:hypothetical protein